jgi:hypothetical protein
MMIVFGLGGLGTSIKKTNARIFPVSLVGAQALDANIVLDLLRGLL